ncbi:MAG TPA: ABC transporter ATP-binding protein, partial [Chloroflexota bacterium]
MLAGLLLTNIALQLINPQFLRAFIDGAQAAAPLHTLFAAALAYLGVAVLSQISSVAETYLAEQVGWIATNRLRADLTLHCLSLDMAFHKQHTPGELIERVDGDISALANFFSRFVIAILGNLLLMLGVLVLVFGIDWRIGLALAILTALGFVAANGLRDRAVPHWAAARQASADLYGFLEERLGGTEDLRANGATAYAVRQLAVYLGAVLRHQRLASVVGGAAWSTLNLLFAGGLAAVFVLGAVRYHAGALSIGTVYLALYYTQMLQRPLEAINRQMQDFQRAAAGIARILTIFAEQPILRDGPGAVFPVGPLTVAVDDVTFRYDEGEPVLHNLSFQLAPGQVLGVLGRTGSGKTSL